MSKPWMPMYWGDYLANTMHLDTIEHGAYILLIAHYWEHEGLPANSEELRKICKLSCYNWKKISKKLAKFFTSGWKHPRLEAELEKAKILRLKRQIYGAKGGWASRGKTNQQRNYDKQLLKQKGDQSPSNLTSFTSWPRARGSKGTAEEGS